MNSLEFGDNQGLFRSGESFCLLYICNMFLDIVSPLSHNLDCLVILHTVEFHRKYEAIHPEFNGSGMPLKHFIVHYTKGRSHWVDVCCAQRGIAQEAAGRTSGWPTHSLGQHTSCSHTRSSDPSLWCGQKALRCTCYLAKCLSGL